MSAGHGDTELQPHQLRQHLRARDHGDLRSLRFHHLRVIGLNRRRHDDDLSAADVFGRVPLGDSRAQPGQPLGHRCPLEVRPGNAETQVKQDLSDPAHANAADAYEMNFANLTQHRFGCPVSLELSSPMVLSADRRD